MEISVINDSFRAIANARKMLLESDHYASGEMSKISLMLDDLQTAAEGKTGQLTAQKILDQILYQVKDRISAKAKYSYFTFLVFSAPHPVCPKLVLIILWSMEYDLWRAAESQKLNNNNSRYRQIS